jgi:hypothetical protein
MSKQAQTVAQTQTVAAVKAAGTRTVHTLRYAGKDGKEMVSNYTRWSKAVREMRAQLDAGVAVQVERREAQVKTEIVIDGE